MYILYVLFTLYVHTILSILYIHTLMTYGPWYLMVLLSEKRIINAIASALMSGQSLRSSLEMVITYFVMKESWNILLLTLPHVPQ